MNFCCCIGHMCNSNFKYIPTTTKAPKIGAIENRKIEIELIELKGHFILLIFITFVASKPDEINLLLIVGIVCGVAFVVVILFGIAFFYRNKKNAMFNVIPTVSTRYSFSILNWKQIN